MRPAHALSEAIAVCKKEAKKAKISPSLQPPENNLDVIPEESKESKFDSEESDVLSRLDPKIPYPYNISLDRTSCLIE